MSKLWVRNLLGSMLTTGALAVMCIIGQFSQWAIYGHSVTPEHVVGPGASATSFGQTWRLGSIRRITELPKRPTGPTIPQGATLVVVVIERSGVPGSLLCTGILTDGRRRWHDQSSSLVVYPLVRGATQFCSKPGSLQFNFLLPSNVSPTAIDLTDGNGAIALRLML